MCSSEEVQKSQRDLSVDELRGYALIAMIATHAAGSTLVIGRALLLELRRRELLVGVRGVLSLLGRNSLFVFCAHLVLLLPLIALRVSEYSSMVQMLAMVGLTSLIAVFLGVKEGRGSRRTEWTGWTGWTRGAV